VKHETLSTIAFLKGSGWGGGGQAGVKEVAVLSLH